MVAGQTTADLHTATGKQETEKLSVHQLIVSGAASYVQAHRDGEATRDVQSALAKLSLCRTRALGGRWYKCDDCQGVTKVYNSCGDRHCPLCSGAKRAEFSERASQMLLDGVEYYQVVFTLPEILSTLAHSNRFAKTTRGMR